MLNRYFGDNTHTFLHILGVCGVAFGVPMNKVVMSVSMMFLVLNLLLEADFKNYWKGLKSNRLFHLIAAFYLFHAVSLLWSADLDYGIHDLRAKLPLLVIPFVLAARPISQVFHRNLIFGAFLLSITIVSVINFAAYNGLIGHFQYDDIRGMSLFGSHVRFSLLVVMAIAICLHMMVKKQASTILLVLLLAWLNYYTYFSQVLSGAFSLLAVYIVLVFYLVWQKKQLIAVVGLGAILVSLFLALFYIFKPIEINPAHFENLIKRTAKNGVYQHQVKVDIVSPETGKPIYIYVCEPELRTEWNKVSDMPFDSLDLKGQHLKNTLIRYMASKDLIKDAEGFAKLNQEDVQLIEKGVASYRHEGILARINGLRFQLNNVKNPNGHSFLQRIEYWSTAREIVRENYLLGVGAGDVQAAFDKQYELQNSPLESENRDRAHNMYLTTLLSLGLLGFGLLMWSHLSFFALQFRQKEIVAFLFMTIILVSYIVEDTLETQTGVTFFALFYGLFSFRSKKRFKA